MRSNTEQKVQGRGLQGIGYNGRLQCVERERGGAERLLETSQVFSLSQ